jgi:hypothetical protein
MPSLPPYEHPGQFEIYEIMFLMSNDLSTWEDNTFRDCKLHLKVLPQIASPSFGVLYAFQNPVVIII